MAVTGGQLGTGKFLLQRACHVQSIFLTPPPNFHSMTVDPNGVRLVVYARIGGSNGNDRVI